MGVPNDGHKTWKKNWFPITIQAKSSFWFHSVMESKKSAISKAISTWVFFTESLAVGMLFFCTVYVYMKDFASASATTRHSGAN